MSNIPFTGRMKSELDDVAAAEFERLANSHASERWPISHGRYKLGEKWRLGFVVGAVWARSIFRRAAEKAEQERDHWEREAAGANADLAHLRAAEPHPVTPDDITDEMVQRAWAAIVESPGWRIGTLHEDGPTVRRALTAALTAALPEPPDRPEGAEAFDPIVDAAIRGHSDITSPDVVRAISDALAEEGARAPEGSGR
jgi:hypothetical protein